MQHQLRVLVTNHVSYKVTKTVSIVHLRANSQYSTMFVQGLQTVGQIKGLIDSIDSIFTN